MKIEVNETPVRTSRNFNINNIKLKDVKIPKRIGNFNNVSIRKETSKIDVESVYTDCNLKFGLGEDLLKMKNL